MPRTSGREVWYEAAILNRKRLRKSIPSHFVALEGGSLIRRNGDCHYPFRQNSNFLFLTGHDAPRARMLMSAADEILFIPRTDRQYRVWVGDADTTASAKKRTGFKRVCYLDEFEREFKAMARKHRECLTTKEFSTSLRKVSARTRFVFEPLDNALRELRIEKTAEELVMLKSACDVTSRAHETLMRETRPGMYEYEVAAIFHKEISTAGMTWSYPPIVGAASNAAVIHYGALTRKIRKGDFVLVDAGAEDHGYASDITRTYVVGGRFSRFQRDLYTLVLEANKAAINRMKPGITAQEITRGVHEELIDGLLAMKVLKGKPADILENRAISVFLPHGLMHSVGLDVHDASPRPPKTKRGHKPGSQRPLRLGLFTAIEAALYFVPPLLKDKDIRKRHGKFINWPVVNKHMDLGGIRIEDNVLLTPRGAKVVTSAAKEVDEVSELARLR